ncbi:VOC family protein [Actinoplanes couchii]|uniref:VOC family protein n=1 Tax=Actinoplanes couchii TaxID=403638 RepID=UPI001EF1A8E0|nr:VOC family protein [Actinoplanes couchii]MDR6319324.1 putative enzyme related to lactoylglutathione lyase [Actinoplanes couchii]
MTAFLDTPSREAEPFWVAVTASVLSARRGGGTFATLVPAEGDACVRVQVVGDPPARAHLDLHVDDVDAVEVAGATVVRTEEGLRVLSSPAGIVFCLVPWGGESVRPRRASVVDQVCLDIPEHLYDRECRFWSELTGWALRPSDLAEFSYLERPTGMGIRLLLQRTGSTTAGVHLDFACTDVDAEVRRHVASGAEVVRRVPGDWTTLRDPVGREYCVTGRDPYSS